MRLSAKFILIYCFFAALLAAPAVAQSSLTNTVDSLNRLASLCYKRHDYSQAGEYGRQAMNICRKAGDMEGYAKYAHSVGQCYN
ncbi:hypothetical protein AGMMS50239_29210 [Bacteroidia bacterium]|nr:hypothetical protein AGMMS50239_29210 [Bacteroidia bacterium]